MDPRPEWHCRIGKITPKDGRPVVRVLRPGDFNSPVELIELFRRETAYIADQFKHDGAGFAVVMWSRAGEYIRSRFNTRSSPIAKTWLPAVVAEILRRDEIRDTVHGVLNNQE